MTDLMHWMYEHYIRPQIESRSKDANEIVCFDLLYNGMDPQMEQDLQTVLAFYAVQGFRLGVRTGLALKDDL